MFSYGYFNILQSIVANKAKARSVRAGIVVLLSGANLILIQWVLVRELTALLLGTELIVLLVTISYFIGLSLGYFVSNRVNPKLLWIWGAVTLILHLGLPILFRLTVAGLATSRLYVVAFVLLPLLTPLLVSSFYSIFLPYFADLDNIDVGYLYGAELLGSGLGIIILLIFGNVGISAVYLMYSVNLLALLTLLSVHRKYILLAGGLCGFWLLVLPTLNLWSTARWYEAVHGLSTGTVALSSVYSSYQKVDVLQEPNGSRHLYLDGLSHFDSSSGQRINVVLGWIPARLLSPKNALVIGAGVMRTEQILASAGAEVSTVELDPAVVQAALDYFIDFNGMDHLTNRQIVIDDAKSFLSNTPHRYNLIAGDVPAAYSIQTATLHTQSFFELVHMRLQPDGVFATNLTSQFGPHNLVARRIAAGLLNTFDEVIIVTPASIGWSFAFASDDLPFTQEQLDIVLSESGEQQYSIYGTAAVRNLVGNAQPLTIDSMDLVLQVSANWIQSRWRW
jgi:spermidine synthase